MPAALLRPRLLLALLLAAVAAVSARAWLSAGETARAELRDRSEGVADVLAAAVRASRGRARRTEEREQQRLAAVARRLRAELALPRGPAAARLEEFADEERLGRVFLFGAGGTAAVRVARPATTDGGSMEAEWRRARETAAPVLRGEAEAHAAGARLNVWGTLQRVSAAVRLEEGGALLVESDAEDVAALARGSDLTQVLADVCRLPDVAAAALHLGEEPVAEAGAPPAEGYAVVRTVGGGESGAEAAPALTLTLRVSTARVDDLARSARRGILLWSGAALLGAGGLALALTRRAAARRREQQAEAARQREQRHLAEMGVLTGLLVHELSSPLNALALQLGGLERTLAAAGTLGPAEEDFARLRRTLGRARTALESFLTLAPAEAGSAGLYGLPALERTLAELREEHPGADLRLTVAPGAGGLRPRVREALLDQALRNVLRNALQAQPSGGRVDVAWEASAPGRVALAVRDAGPGLPAELLERGPALGRSTRPGGHGLGLFLAQRVAAGAGGALRLQNPAGGGALVVLDLPAAPAEEAR